MYSKQIKKATKPNVADFLSSAGIRATRQRLALAAILFDGTDKHMTAEQVHEAARKSKCKIALATVYNSLHHFTEMGLLRAVTVDQQRIYFDTNVGKHYHFFDETSGQLIDIPAQSIELSRLPKAPAGRQIEHIDIILRLADNR